MIYHSRSGDHVPACTQSQQDAKIKGMAITMQWKLLFLLFQMKDVTTLRQFAKC